MKPFFLLALLSAINPLPAQAQTSPGLDVTVLKEKVGPHRAQLDAGIERARGIKGNLRGASREISYEDCKDLEAKIEAQYPLSPFRAAFKNGASFSSFCDWNPQSPSKDEAERAGKRYFFEPFAGNNQLGVPAAYIVRILTPKPHGFGRLDSGEGEYLLDSQFRFVEINGRTTYRNQKGFDWDISILAPNGDRFYHSGAEASGDRGFPVEHLIYGSADGTLTASWRKAPRRADHGREIIVTRSMQVNQKNWENQFSILNLINGVQFYQYENEWTSRPTAYDYLFEVNLAEGGKEVCADGSSVETGKYTRYGPSDRSDSYACFNIW